MADSQYISGKPGSFWVASTPTTKYPPLPKDFMVDVAIIGGGIVGITTAFLLKQAGKTVAVIEAGKILERVTGRTTTKQ